MDKYNHLSEYPVFTNNPGFGNNCYISGTFSFLFHLKSLIYSSSPKRVLTQTTRGMRQQRVGARLTRGQCGGKAMWPLLLLRSPSPMASSSPLPAFSSPAALASVHCGPHSMCWDPNPGVRALFRSCCADAGVAHSFPTQPWQLYLAWLN